MAQEFLGGETFTTTSPGNQVTDVRLNNHMNGAIAQPGLITNRTDVATAIAADDTLLIHDQSASGLKKVEAQNLLPSAVVTNKTDISTAIAAADLLLMADASDSNNLKKVQAQNILPPEAISAKTDISATTAQNDYVLLGDTSDSNNLKKGTVASLQPSGALIQCVADVETASTTTTASIPIDDTVPTSGEGTEILSQSITPGNASNILEVEFEVPYSCNTSGTAQVAALLRDGTGVAATFASLGTNAGNNVLRAVYRVAAGATSSTTFAVRVGTSGGTLTFNGQSGGRLFGGAMAARLIIRELKA